MCWKDEAEPYNDGRAFKVVCRDARGVMVTVIADNYFGYCKKEVKTQISFAANLFGSCEEEHAGGALAFATYVLGQDFYRGPHGQSEGGAVRRRAANLLGDLIELQPEGYAVDQLLSERLLCAGERRLPHAGRIRALAARRRRSRGCRCAPEQCTFCPRASA